MQTVKLKDVVMRVKDKIDKDNTHLEYYIGGEHIDSGELCITKKGKLEGSTIGPAFHMHFMPGDVLLMSRNPHLKKAGVVDFEGICSDVSYICRTKDENILSQRYLPFIFQTDHFWKFVEENKKGGLPFFLNWSDFEKYEFQLPSIDKQREMADLLWAAQETKLAYIELLKQTDELVKSQFIEMFGTPEDNHHEYPIGTISDVVCDVHYGTSKKASENGKYTYIRMNNITYDGELDLIDTKRISVPENELEGCIVRKGDVLFNRTNSRELVGKTCVFTLNEPMIIAGYIIRLRMNGKARAEYISTFLNLKSSKLMLMAMAKGAVGQANINAKEVKSIRIVIPPHNIQQQFCQLVEQSDKSKFEIKKSIQNINVLMKSLMQENYNK